MGFGKLVVGPHKLEKLSLMVSTHCVFLLLFKKSKTFKLGCKGLYVYLFRFLLQTSAKMDFFELLPSRRPLHVWVFACVDFFEVFPSRRPLHVWIFASIRACGDRNPTSRLVDEVTHALDGRTEK